MEKPQRNANREKDKQRKNTKREKKKQRSKHRERGTQQKNKGKRKLKNLKNTTENKTEKTLQTGDLEGEGSQTGPRRDLHWAYASRRRGLLTLASNPNPMQP